MGFPNVNQRSVCGGGSGAAPSTYYKNVVLVHVRGVCPRKRESSKEKTMQIACIS